MVSGIHAFDSAKHLKKHWRRGGLTPLRIEWDISSKAAGRDPPAFGHRLSFCQRTASKEHSVEMKSAADCSGDVPPINLLFIPNKVTPPVTTEAEKKSHSSIFLRLHVLRCTPVPAEPHILEGTEILQPRGSRHSERKGEQVKYFLVYMAKKLSKGTNKSMCDIGTANDISWRREKTKLLLDQ